MTAKIVPTTAQLTDWQILTHPQQGLDIIVVSVDDAGINLRTAILTGPEQQFQINHIVHDGIVGTNLYKNTRNWTKTIRFLSKSA